MSRSSETFVNQVQKNLRRLTREGSPARTDAVFRTIHAT